jgi:hypothetical protein
MPNGAGLTILKLDRGRAPFAGRVVGHRAETNEGCQFFDRTAFDCLLDIADGRGYQKTKTERKTRWILLLIGW